MNESSLADRLYRKGYHLYGVFSDCIRLSKGFEILTEDMKRNRVSSPKIMTLAELLKDSFYTCKRVVVHPHYAKNVDINDAYVIYAKPTRVLKLPKSGSAVRIIELHSDSGQIVKLKGVPFKEEYN